MSLLANKVILIVGGTSGIGKSTAIEAALNGASVVIAGRRIEHGTKVVEAIKKKGGKAVFIQTDVTKEEDVKNLISKTVEVYGRLDGAFNNVGAINVLAPLDLLNSNDYHSLIATNLDSVFYCLKYEIQQFKKQRKDNPEDKTVFSIVNNSSAASLAPASNFGHYSATKAAMDSLTKTAALENGTNPSIRVNSILPGPIRTEIVSDDLIKSLEPKIALKRAGKPEEVAKPVVFLLSDHASFITGALLPIDGGLLVL